MSDNYQAVYDAVRSRISGCSVGDVLASAAREAFDISHQKAIGIEQFVAAVYEHQRPAVLFRPALTVDGNQYCALYGDDIQSGVAGFGATASEAMADFDRNWLTMKAPPQRPKNKPGG